MLGYRHYSDELVDYFVKKSIDNGIDILRIFDVKKYRLNVNIYYAIIHIVVFKDIVIRDGRI